MGKIAFIFSGQGAQYPGMGKDLYENFEVSKEIFEKAKIALGFDVTKLCFEGPQEELNKTENTQPTILTMSIAALRALESKGIHADVTAGLSLGEYSALVCSGVFKFEDAVKLVKKRGRFMQDAVPVGIGAMAAILGLEAEKIKEACEKASEIGIVEGANFNCPGQIVIAGEVKAVERAAAICKELGAKRAMMLPVSAPFHTSMLAPAGEKLAEELKDIELLEMNIPVITNVTGEYIEDIGQVKEILKTQLKSSVMWEHTIRNMIRDGVDTFVEIGPGKTLCGFVKKIDKNLKIVNVEDLASLENAVTIINS
ncbi:MAG: ACP S-malonyltransferase [Clostridiaceae bacterium]|nr:ACP S-malonyltransferase [Clostridiaceae bacterium]